MRLTRSLSYVRKPFNFMGFIRSLRGSEGLENIEADVIDSQEHNVAQRVYGQPTFETHPHMLNSDQVTFGITRAEYQTRRENLMKMILKSSGSSYKRHMVVVPSATVTYRTADIPQPFYQSSDFLYLSGFQEPDSVLVLENKPGHNCSDVKSTLFVLEDDPKSLLWHGPRSGSRGAPHVTGVDDAMCNTKLDSYLTSNYRHGDDLCIWCIKDYNHYLVPAFYKEFVHGLSNFSGTSAIKGVTEMIHRLRAVKSKAECALMRNACDITCRSFEYVLKQTIPNVSEREIEIRWDFRCRTLGARGVAYPPVVAGGKRANIIHYISNDQNLARDEILLMDAGCYYHGYCSDVTRVWPVGGSFSEKEKVLVDALVWVQSQLVTNVLAGTTIADLYNRMLDLLSEVLKSLAIIPKYLSGAESRQRAKMYCPHDIGHFLGMDVHDTPTVSRHTPLEPGMIITVEPGIYIHEHDTDVLKDWRGVGLRIEDDVLVTNTFAENLTLQLPKLAQSMEYTMMDVN